VLRSTGKFILEVSYRKPGRYEVLDCSSRQRVVDFVKKFVTIDYEVRDVESPSHWGDVPGSVFICTRKENERNARE